MALARLGNAPGLCRRGGTAITATASRKYRSARTLPCTTAAFRSAQVLLRIRQRIWRTELSPRGRYWASSNTPNNEACAREGSSATSSR
ncbi:hypothetical protein G6F68_018716 [Rhizopus microsporus]|nr:hypothetical protein G6F68_018716 [Rhizopus microsporus]